MTKILLHNAESLIQVTGLLSDEDFCQAGASKPFRIWAATAKRQDGKVSPPQLAQCLVDALDEARNAGLNIWRDLATLLEAMPLYYDRYL